MLFDKGGYSIFIYIIDFPAAKIKATLADLEVYNFACLSEGGDHVVPATNLVSLRPASRESGFS